VLSGGPPTTPDQRLLAATALRRQLRYEAALNVLRAGRDADGPGASLDPAWRFPLLSAEATLLVLTHQPEQAAALTPELEAAAATCLDPGSARDELAVLTRQLSVAVPGGVEAALQHTRRLVAQARPEEAENLLVGLRSRAATVQERMLWHLAAGELELALTGRRGTPQGLDQAIGHLEQAVELAAGTATADVRGFALRTLGRACYRRPGDGRASQFWAEAYRVEEAIAARQETDEVRLRMLQAAPDEHDEAVRAAAQDAAARGPGAVAGIVVALEAGRGNSLLAGLRPDSGTVHSPPAPGDLTGAWRWVRDLTRDIPRAQLVWLLHATPERLHHVLLGCGTARHASYPVSRPRLIREVNALVACWVPEVLELSMARGEFDRALQALTERLAVTDVLRAVPGHVDRLVVVAAGELADIPFAALPLGTGGRLLDRFAVSELPSLSVRRVLRLRALRQRGDRSLLVSPPAGGLSRAAPLPGASVLAGPEATPGGLAAALGKGRVRQVRIDCHGGYDQEEHARSWLQLAPHGPSGRLYPASLGELDLSRCGTVVLGACESGMTRRRGRDERDGFVRAALLAGAGSVMAARWPAEDGAAAAVLDRCQQYLRFLPRDVALRKAQLDVYHRTGGTGAELEHPGRWACWSLYGDPGMQTRAGPVRQRVRARRGEALGRQR
jgi:CHAT domain